MNCDFFYKKTKKQKKPSKLLIIHGINSFRVCTYNYNHKKALQQESKTYYYCLYH